MAVNDWPQGRSYALLLATGRYTDPTLGQLRSPSRDAEELARVLRDPAIGGYDAATFVNEPDARLREEIEGFFADRRLDDLLLFYVSCHGVKDPSGRLYFAASTTKLNRLASTGISAEFLFEQVDRCRARRILVLLDCCYSGSYARGHLPRAGNRTEIGIREGRGRAAISSSTEEEYSFEIETGKVTGAASPSLFTAAVVRGLDTGAADLDGDGLVSVDELYAYVKEQVREATPYQTPEKKWGDIRGDFFIARNPTPPRVTPEPLSASVDVAHDGAVAVAGTRAASNRTGGGTGGKTVGEAKEPVLGDGAASARLLADAERTAHSITNKESQSWALVSVAKGLAASNPDRAARLIANAESIAQSITGEVAKASALTGVAQALAATDPDRAARLLTEAERTARSITDESMRRTSLGGLARAMAAIQPERAERLAHSISSESSDHWILASVAQLLAATEPDRAARLIAEAESIAQSITGEVAKASALTQVAQALAATDPDRAARLLTEAQRTAHSITEEHGRALALTLVAEALVASDPDRAARLIADAESAAQSLSDKWSKISALASVARALAATDPYRAVSLAESISKEKSSVPRISLSRLNRMLSEGEKETKMSVLVSVAEGVAATDPYRAERLAQSIDDKERKAMALNSIVGVLAATDPHGAESIARSITDKKWKGSALACVAEALAVTDPDRAERLAQSITDSVSKVSALVTLAKHTPSDDSAALRPADAYP
jgi:hypothetical protein